MPDQPLFVARSFGTHFVITANTTGAGGPVYLRADRSWTEHLTEAVATQDEALRDELLEFGRSQERTVCDPYTFKVNVDDDGKPLATTVRERIRAQGPSTPLRRPDNAA